MIYEVLAIEYAHHPRRASENFIGDPLGGHAHDGPICGAFRAGGRGRHGAARLRGARPRPFSSVWSVADMVEGYARLQSLAQAPGDVIPAHDPLVLERYPAAAPDSRA